MFIVYESELKDFEEIRQRKKEVERENAVKKEAVKPIEQMLKKHKEKAIVAQRSVNSCLKNVQSCLRSQVFTSTPERI